MVCKNCSALMINGRKKMKSSINNTSRRRFLAACAKSVKPLKIGVIGCGGRGTGAVENAIMADPFPDMIERSLKELTSTKRRGGHLKGIEVREDHIFTGLDGYKSLLETDVDYVILAEPPDFRPLHFEAAIEEGKHVFMEKPITTDPVGVNLLIQVRL